MESPLIFLGLLFVGGGFIRWSAPNLGGETFVSPEKVRRSPEWAAEKHERRAKLLGLFGMICGGILIAVGLIAP